MKNLFILLSVLSLHVFKYLFVVVSIFFMNCQDLLTHFMPPIYFYTSWKYQKMSVFLIFSGGKEKPGVWNGLSKPICPQT